MLSGLWIDSNSQIPAKAPGLLSEECRVVSDGIGSEANKTRSARKSPGTSCISKLGTNLIYSDAFGLLD